jgi:hypothetical protein
MKEKRGVQHCFVRLGMLFLVLLMNSMAIAQVPIDFYPKQLVREVSKGTKLTSADFIELSEIADDPAMGKFFSLDKKWLPSFSFVYIGRVNCCRAGGCSKPSAHDPGGQSEYFDYYILYSDSASVQKIKIFNYSATHGQEVTNAGWLKQFEDYMGNTELQVGKNIDAISGATVSVFGLVADVEEKTQQLQKWLKRKQVVLFEPLH